MFTEWSACDYNWRRWCYLTGWLGPNQSTDFSRLQQQFWDQVQNSPEDSCSLIYHISTTLTLFFFFLSLFFFSFLFLKVHCKPERSVWAIKMRAVSLSKIYSLISECIVAPLLWANTVQLWLQERLNQTLAGRHLGWGWYEDLFTF